VSLHRDLHWALQQLAEPFLTAAGDAAAVAAEARSKLRPPAPAAHAPDARGRRVRARLVREELLSVATEVNDVIEAAVQQEALRLAPLAMTLDWLVQPPAEASLTRQLALVAQAEPLAQRVGEVAGALGSIRREALALGVEGGASEEPLEALVRVRLARVGALVDRWLELRHGGGTS
jgi:hypothetical protein